MVGENQLQASLIKSEENISGLFVVDIKGADYLNLYQELVITVRLGDDTHEFPFCLSQDQASCGFIFNDGYQEILGIKSISGRYRSSLVKLTGDQLKTSVTNKCMSYAFHSSGDCFITDGLHFYQYADRAVEKFSVSVIQEADKRCFRHASGYVSCNVFYVDPTNSRYFSVPTNGKFKGDYWEFTVSEIPDDVDLGDA
jgi:hypothetical protein